MSTSRNLETPAGITPADIYFVIFRHKWKIISLTLLGLAAAAVFYFAKPPLYQSEAQIFIRYILDTQGENPAAKSSRMTSMLDEGQKVMNSEIAILNSYDLAAKVATNIGPEKILAKVGGGDNATAAAACVKSHLKVEIPKESSVIYVTFLHPDPELVRPVLSQIISEYFENHKRVHAIGMTEAELEDKINNLRLEIAQTENELSMAKTNARIISVADTEKALTEDSARISRELRQAQASLFERQTSMNELASAAASKGGVTNLFASVSPETASRYKSVCSRLTFLERQQNDFIQQGFTESNKLVKENRDQMVAAAKAKVELETQFPMLAEMGSGGENAGSANSLPQASESVQTASLPLRIKVLEAQLNEIQGEAANLNTAEAKIADLDRKKTQQEATYQFLTSLQNQERIDATGGPSRASNISEIQFPSPPFKDFNKFHKTIGLLAVSGLLVGLLWAFLIEFYLDRSIKRPVDFQTKIRMPFFISIPDLNYHPRRGLPAPERRQLAYAGETKPTNGNGTLEVALPTANQALHSHYDALRDRLVNYFESINLTRKPKLVAITSTAKGAGVSTISAGLAASLSETGDGRVLLVDMNLENGAAQQFVRGKADSSLEDALVSEKRDGALVQENLYVVSEGSNADKLPRVLPKRFASLIPKLKASDYDYIIFDMPPVTQTSVTTRLAGFMDTVMLIIESEKTDREVVNQANQLLQQSKANVTAVLNKTRRYIPSRLQHDIHADL